MHITNLFLNISVMWQIFFETVPVNKNFWVIKYRVTESLLYIISFHILVCICFSFTLLTCTISLFYIQMHLL
jgi:hypothetical protein